MDFHRYFIEISIDKSLKFQLDLQIIPLVFHWNCYWIPTRFPMDFNFNFIEFIDMQWISIGVSLKYQQIFIEITTRFPLLFNEFQMFIWISNWISNFRFPISSFSTWILTVFPMDFHWYFIEISTGFPINLYWYFIEISIGIWLKFQLDLQLIPLIFHWNWYWIPTRFPMDFHVYFIEFSTGYNGFPLVFHWNINRYSLKWQLYFHCYFVNFKCPFEFPIKFHEFQMSIWISN